MRRQVLALCAVFLMGLLQTITSQTPEVCPGTMNALSITGNPDQHYRNLKERYNGCEIILGNLEITHMEDHLDFSFLNTIREVTGYILIAMNQFRRLPLERLRVIRGKTLYEKEWALSVFLNFEGSNGLEELGFTNLTEILEGGVQIVNNKHLKYAPSINWHDIVHNSSSQIQIQDDGEKGQCHPSCGKHCWGPSENQCQTLTKTVCAPQCNGRCFGTSPRECCDMECAGGCTGPLDTDCFACRHVNESRACVSRCPQPHIYNRHTFQLEPNPNAMYQYGSYCVKECPAHFVVDGSACVSNCPPGKMEVEKNGIKQCEPCAGLCQKVCEGTGSSHRQTVDSSNIDTFINCTTIQGSLHFLVMGIKGDVYNNISALDPEKLKVFSTVREITDILSIQSWPEELSDLSVFSNLTTIRGRSLHNTKRPFSLLVMKVPSLKSLGLRSLREISDGSVYISNNTNLCYHHTIKWRQLFIGNRPNRRNSHNDVKFNKPLSQCVAEGHVCDPLCSDSGCWGPGPEQCLSCRNHSRHGTCVANCNFYSGEPREYAGLNGECLSCHSECLPQEGRLSCRGPGADECVACSSLKDGPHCVSSCPNGVMGEKGLIFKYPNKQGHCELCHLNCTNGCTGPTLRDCVDPSRSVSGPPVAGIVCGVLGGLFICLVLGVLGLLYHRGLAIRRKRALRRYLESGESIEPLDPGEKGSKVHARVLKASELRKTKTLGSGVFGTVHKGSWIPEGDSVKIPVAIKTIQDHSGRQTFTEITDHMLAMGSLDHPYIVRYLGICPGPSLQLVTRLSAQGSLLEYLRQHREHVDPQRLLNWCVQIAKGMYYLEEHCMVHRNLAARNVLLKSNYIVQVSDFGVADLVYPDDKKYVYSEVKTPIKWMALESILFRRFSHQSDVWSYGVTVWEMMSYGAEPYAAMHPQEVPGLLEKGERLSQPPICTIDVYMVMVKCWMIDENIRPTFKELANEFTRMARDPPRYLVINPHCSSPVLDENQQRETKLARIEADLVDEDEETLTDGFVTLPFPVSPSRSLSRLNSYRSLSAQSAPVGYLPMTPSTGDISRQLWQQRPRRGSARTTSECSEGRGTLTDTEMTEFSSHMGSLRRGRNRADSAYTSTSMSVALDMSSPGHEGADEDPNGYVLPRSTHSPERDALLGLKGSRTISSHGWASKGSRSPQGPSTPVTDPTQDYELMSKQPPPLLPRSLKSPTDSSASPANPTNCSTGLPPHEGDGEYLQPQQQSQRNSSPTGGSPECKGQPVKEAEGQQVENGNCGVVPSEEPSEDSVVEYEYMDIGRADSPAVDEEEMDRSSECDVTDSDEQDREDKTQSRAGGKLTDDGDYQNSTVHRAEGKITSTGQEDEYEDMDACGGVLDCGGDEVEYQNVQGKGRPLRGEGVKGSGLGAYMKVRAGVGEPNSNTSFDNPDYWHSRLLLKQDAVRT
ncbi:receptor tyrosine-protein kinase erbB-3b [Chanos chanos]|uniref:Receptor protein-tyrosine kinase n=1 Tax=Chanos chanos TaxID=29144 RepID=A0A6J2UYD8_CHACN|nr:receptor tyrosine-protein kinase erbB-3-like [Chanos chanos]